MSVAGDMSARKARLEAVLGDSNAAIADKGGTVASNLSGLPAAIAGLKSGGKYQEKSVTPTGKEIVVAADSGYDALSKVTVAGDYNLKPWNIPEGITIYGVVGTAKLSVTTDPPADLPVSKDDADAALAENDATADTSAYDLMVLAQDDGNITYCYLAKDTQNSPFTITSYDPITTEFKAKGWRRLSYHTTGEQAGTWTYDDFTDTESGGWNYLKNIRSCSREKLYYNGYEVWPENKMPSVEIVPWSTGTDEQIAAMVAALDAGKITVEETGWSVGDERTVHLSAMDATGVGDAHVEQDVVMVLGNVGGKYFEDGTECHFVVLQKDCLQEQGSIGKVNENTGDWEHCLCRSWCNNVYPYSIPTTLRSIFKRFKNISGNQVTGETQETIDLFALASAGEIFDTPNGIYVMEIESNEQSQFEWYKTAENRIKQMTIILPGNASWWTRSPSVSLTSYCYVNDKGNISNYGLYGRYGIAPFGCI